MGQCNCGKEEEKYPWVLSTENYDFDLSNMLLILAIIVIVCLLNREC
tara:strand:+ start:1542 stop:1682 length:141 start_codon:yes stop_codon:yes gene_type:complete